MLYYGHKRLWRKKIRNNFFFILHEWSYNLAERQAAVKQIKIVTENQFQFIQNILYCYCFDNCCI